MLDDAPAEIEVVQLCGRRFPLVTHMVAVTAFVATSSSCTSSPPLTLTYCLGAPDRGVMSTSNRRRFSWREDFERPSSNFGANDDFEENRLHQLGRSRVTVRFVATIPPKIDTLSAS